MVRDTEPELEMNFFQFNTGVGHWEPSAGDSENCSLEQNPAGPHGLFLRVIVHKNYQSFANTIVSLSSPLGVHLFLGRCLSLFVVCLYWDLISNTSK